MPFGICSAPEVFQCQMHEVIGLTGVEVIGLYRHVPLQQNHLLQWREDMYTVIL